MTPAERCAIRHILTVLAPSVETQPAIDALDNGDLLAARQLAWCQSRACGHCAWCRLRSQGVFYSDSRVSGLFLLALALDDQSETGSRITVACEELARSERFSDLMIELIAEGLSVEAAVDLTARI
jgi:hypothetical protein